MRRIVILTLTLALAVTACTGEADTTTMMEPTIPVDDSMRGVPTGEEVSVATPEERKVIHRAAISIETEDTRWAYRTIREMVRESDGFIQSATISDPESGEDQPRIDVVMRIPAEGLDTALDEIGALGTRIVSQSQQGEDVTEEYVDLEARIDNLSLLEEELRALLEEVRQNRDADPQKLLQVFNEISRVRGEIEQLQGRRQVLDDLTELATVEVHVSPTPEAAPVVAEGWAPLAVARQSLQDLVGALQGLTDATIRFGVFLLPLLLLAALPVGIVWRLRHRISFWRGVPGG